MQIQMPPSRFADLDGPVHYVEWDGPPGRTFVLVHGLGGSLLSWLAVAPGLAMHGRVLAMDLPGFGRTERNGRRSRVSDLRGTVSRFVDEVAGGGPVVLVGNSMGGAISMLEAALEPAAVEALVLSNSVFPWKRGSSLPATGRDGRLRALRAPSGRRMGLAPTRHAAGGRARGRARPADHRRGSLDDPRGPRPAPRGAARPAPAEPRRRTGLPGGREVAPFARAGGARSCGGSSGRSSLRCSWSTDARTGSCHSGSRWERSRCGRTGTCG